MQLEILTPGNKIFQGEVSEASFPGSGGAFQVLTNHAPIVAALAKGTISYTTSEGKQSIIVDGGVVEVKDNVIVVLAEKVIS